MPRSPDPAIFVLTDRQTDRTDCFTPCACTQGNYKEPNGSLEEVGHDAHLRSCHMALVCNYAAMRSKECHLRV